MKAVDTTFLVAYLTEDGEGPVAEFLEATENEPLYAPTLALNEVYRGVIFADGAEPLEPSGQVVDRLGTDRKSVV